MSGDIYNTGQAGAVGPNAHAHDMTFQQVQNQGAIDLPRLAEELARLRAAMKEETEGTAEQDEAIGAVAAAGKAAGQGDDRTMLRHLKTAGAWTLGIAEKIGVAVAAEAIKRAM
jgi:deferrochelatase/peroxidase EfeB